MCASLAEDGANHSFQTKDEKMSLFFIAIIGNGCIVFVNYMFIIELIT